MVARAMNENTAPAPLAPPVLAEPVHDGPAVASLILSIFWLGGLGSLLAVIFGHVSRGTAKRAARKPSSLATAGTVIGWLGILAAIVAFIAIGIAASHHPPPAQPFDYGPYQNCLSQENNTGLSLDCSVYLPGSLWTSTSPMPAWCHARAWAPGGSAASGWSAGNRGARAVLVIPRTRLSCMTCRVTRCRAPSAPWRLSYVSQELCKCPILRFAAESERLAQMGVIPDEGQYAMEARIAALIIGVARVEHECAGPNRFGVCPFYYSQHRVSLTTDPSVPLLKRRAPVNPETGQML